MTTAKGRHLTDCSTQATPKSCILSHCATLCPEAPVQTYLLSSLSVLFLLERVIQRILIVPIIQPHLMSIIAKHILTLLYPCLFWITVIY